MKSALFARAALLLARLDPVRVVVADAVDDLVEEQAVEEVVGVLGARAGRAARFGSAGVKATMLWTTPTRDLRSLRFTASYAAAFASAWFSITVMIAGEVPGARAGSSPARPSGMLA